MKTTLKIIGLLAYCINLALLLFNFAKILYGDINGNVHMFILMTFFITWIIGVVFGIAITDKHINK